MELPPLPEVSDEVLCRIYDFSLKYGIDGPIQADGSHPLARLIRDNEVCAALDYIALGWAFDLRISENPFTPWRTRNNITNYRGRLFLRKASKPLDVENYFRSVRPGCKCHITIAPTLKCNDLMYYADNPEKRVDGPWTRTCKEFQPPKRIATVIAKETRKAIAAHPNAPRREIREMTRVPIAKAFGKHNEADESGDYAEAFGKHNEEADENGDYAEYEYDGYGAPREYRDKRRRTPRHHD